MRMSDAVSIRSAAIAKQNAIGKRRCDVTRRVINAAEAIASFGGTGFVPETLAPGEPGFLAWSLR